MPEQRTPTQEELVYHNTIIEYTERHFEYMHGRLSYLKLMVAYENMLSCYSAVNPVESSKQDKETVSA